jgi:cobaltochelatase CobS
MARASNTITVTFLIMDMIPFLTSPTPGFWHKNRIALQPSMLLLVMITKDRAGGFCYHREKHQQGSYQPAKGDPMNTKVAELFGVSLPGEIRPRRQIDGLPYPEANPHFVFQPQRLAKLLRFFAGQAARNNLLLIGPAGAGKTAVIEQVAARLGWPVWAVSCSGKVRASHWFGTFALRDGATVWQDGPLALALRHGGIFLADEITRLDPAEQMALVRVLDGGEVTIPETGEVIRPHKLFRFVGTGNSGGFGDETGAYVGERVSSFAFLDRFLKTEVDFLGEDDELRLIARVVPNLPSATRNALVRLARAVRDASQAAGKGELRVNISTRALLAVARETRAYQTMGIQNPLLEALNDVVLAGTPSEDRDAVQTILDKFIRS